MTIFEVAGKHGRAYGTWAGIVMFALLYGGNTMTNGQTPPGYMFWAYAAMGLATWGITAAIVYTVYTWWAAGSFLPPIYFVEFDVDGTDLPRERQEIRAMPTGQPVRSQPPRPTGAESIPEPVADTKQLSFDGSQGAAVVCSMDALGSYPHIYTKLLRFLSDRRDVVISGHTLAAADVVSRDNRVHPNGSWLIQELAAAGIIRLLSNNQYVLTDAGSTWVEEKMK